ncbi:hypothetical protein F5Y11DRAFT_357716 [Daldinia sp. FL1419]|nr:hypothetical protein F5Y11DRAFT_357716 [Daldinia sp. FL1419]
MSDESKDDYHQPRQLDMPLISIPTETLNTDVLRPGGRPASLTAVSVPGATDFVLGVDTCGFTTSSTITCEFGYECTDVGGYRGCCLPGAGDCASTIYTDCIDYENIPPNTEECGPQTLCCPSENPSCYTYWVDNNNGPETTKRHIECQTTQGFGILYPFPPELTMTSDTSTTEVSPSSDPSTTDQAALGSGDDSQPPSLTSAGTIAGVVVGSVAFVMLIVIISAIILRRRRTKKNNVVPPPVPMKKIDSSTEADVLPSPENEARQAIGVAVARPDKKPDRGSFLRPLSMIREHPLSISNPISIPATSFTPGIRRYKSAAARQSPKPNWPLGPPGNPLGLNPIDADLKKRLSDSRLGTRELENEGIIDIRQKSLPRIPFPLPPPPGTRLVSPLPPLNPNPDPGATGTTPTSATAALQSPRLSHIPVSPIMSRILNGDARRGAVNQVPPSPRPTSAADTETVSPIASDVEEEVAGDLHRFSYISAFSGASEPGVNRRAQVSPVAVDGTESLVTVSPLESPRGSMDS